MELSRRRFFGLFAGAAAAAGASILAPRAGERLTVAPVKAPESYTSAPPIINPGDKLGLRVRATVPDPLDARNWGKTQLAPMDFYECAAEVQDAVNANRNSEAETRLWGTPIYVSRRVPSSCMFFLGTSGIWDVAPDPRYSAVITNIRAPAPCFDDDEEAA